MAAYPYRHTPNFGGRVVGTKSSISFIRGIHVYFEWTDENYYVDDVRFDVIDLVKLRHDLNQWAEKADDDLKKHICECELELERRRAARQREILSWKTTEVLGDE